LDSDSLDDTVHPAKNVSVRLDRNFPGCDTRSEGKQSDKFGKQRTMEFRTQTDEFRKQTDEFRKQTDEFHKQTDEFCEKQTDEFCESPSTSDDGDAAAMSLTEICPDGSSMHSNDICKPSCTPISRQSCLDYGASGDASGGASVVDSGEICMDCKTTMWALKRRSAGGLVLGNSPQASSATNKYSTFFHATERPLVSPIIPVYYSQPVYSPPVYPPSMYGRIPKLFSIDDGTIDLGPLCTPIAFQAPPQLSPLPVSQSHSQSLPHCPSRLAVQSIS
jgi:hypothetical protein